MGIRIIIKFQFYNEVPIQVRLALSSSIISFNWLGEYPTPPMTPRPPALETAAANGAPEVFPIPARNMGC
jgi:hypothetical protein